MELQGQAGQRGYAMAALLVALGVMAVVMSAALPVWRHQMQREKEAELVFRGESYARAIGLYQRKMGPGVLPPTVQALVDGRFLRKEYKDPMVEDGKFFLIYPGQPGQTSQPGQPTTPGRGGTPGGLGGVPARGTTPAVPAAQPQFSGGGQQVSAAGILGVRSKSTETSIRTYRGMNHYNEWPFIAQTQQPGAGGPGRGGPGGGPTGRTPGSTGPGGPGRGTGPGRGPGGGPGGPGRGPAPGGPGRGFTPAGPGRGSH